jgi:5-methylcytosine-specific restriction endonuclease McrA
MQKVCRRCNVTKPTTEFIKSNTGKNGVGSWCKPCFNVYNRRYIAESRKRLLAEGGDRTCTHCGEAKPLTEFRGMNRRCQSCDRLNSKQYYRDNADRLRREAREKRAGWSDEKRAEVYKDLRERNREHYYRNVEENRSKKLDSYYRRKAAGTIDWKRREEYNREWTNRNIEDVKKKRVAYGKKHRDQIQANNKAWRERNPDKVRAHARTCARRRHQRLVGKITAKQLLAIWEFYSDVCQLCHQPANGETLAIDHIIPISRGGLHVWQNVWPTHGRCNSRKKNNIVPTIYPPHILYFRQKWGTYKITPIRKVS